MNTNDRTTVDSWEWIPGRSVGPFVFGASAVEVIKRFRLELQEPACSVAYWETYAIPGCESIISVEDGKITDVLCYDSVRYEGQELLDREWDFAWMLLGHEDEVEEIVPEYIRAIYGDLGLTLWYEAGRIKSATCGIEEDRQ